MHNSIVPTCPRVINRALGIVYYIIRMELAYFFPPLDFDPP